MRLDPGVVLSTNLTKWMKNAKYWAERGGSEADRWLLCGRYAVSPDPTPTPDARKKWKPQIQELARMPSQVLEEWTHRVRLNTSTKAAKLLQDLVEAETDAGAAVFPARWRVEPLRRVPSLVGGVGPASAPQRVEGLAPSKDSSRLRWPLPFCSCYKPLATRKWKAEIYQLPYYLGRWMDVGYVYKQTGPG